MKKYYFLIAFLPVSALLVSCATGESREKKTEPFSLEAGLEVETAPAPVPVPEKGEEPVSHERRESVTRTADRQAGPEPMSLNLGEGELKTVIELLSDGGNNFRYIIHRAAEKKMVSALKLRNVTWREALDIVVRINDLTIIEEDGFFVINTHDGYVAEKEREAQLAVLQNNGMKSTMSFRLQYTRPEEVREYLKTIFRTVNSPGRSGTAGSRMQSAVVTFSIFPKASIITAYGPESHLRDIAERIKEIDVPQKQVFVEARIVDVLRSHTQSLGIQWGGRLDKTLGNGFPSRVAVAGGSGGADFGTTNAAVNFPATDQTGTGIIPASVAIGVSDALGTAQLNMRLSALEQDGKSKTLSNPKVTTINGVTAKIESGREIPYETTSQDGTQTQFKKAVVSLEVTPIITPENTINLKIVAKKEDADFTKQVKEVPSILTRVIETNVLVHDGGTVVLGGLFEDVNAKTETGVPFLSKIPLLGWLFKGKDSLRNEKEFLIFITPTVL